MRNVTNHEFLGTRSRWAKILSILGMAGLIAGILLTSQSYLLSWLFLFIGLIAASIGAHYANLYVRDPRSEEVLDRSLRGFDDRHALYNFVLPIPHLFLTPAGPWILRTMKQRGRIRYDGQRWRQKFTFGRILGAFSEPRLGKPVKELARDIEYLGEELGKAMGEEVPVRGAIVFTDPNLKLEAQNTPLPVIRIDDLKEWMRQELKSLTNLPSQTRRQLQELVDEWAQ